MNGWGYALMAVSVVLFWALVIFGVIALVRFLARNGQAMAIQSTPEQLLAERFASGAINEQEYRQRLDALHDHPRAAVKS